MKTDLGKVLKTAPGIVQILDLSISTGQAWKRTPAMKLSYPAFYAVRERETGIPLVVGQTMVPHVTLLR